MLIAIVIPIVLTLIVGKKKLSKEEKNGKTIAETEEITEKSEAEEKEVTHLTAFLTGDVIPIKEVNDGVFSEGVMGDGIAKTIRYTHQRMHKLRFLCRNQNTHVV